LRDAATVLSLLLLLVSATVAQAQVTGGSLTISVYPDGTVRIVESLEVNASSPSVDTQLLTSVLSDIVVLDQNGNPLSFQINGTKMTIFTLGATSVTIQYDTQTLTNKVGTVWTVGFDTSLNATLFLPNGSTLLGVSSPPESISNSSGSPVLSLLPGNWTINYGLPIQNMTQPPGGNSSGGGSPPGGPSAIFVGAIGLAAIASAGAVGFVLYRRRAAIKGVDLSSELRPDDVRVLEFITEKGGQVLESEIRSSFALPKTTAWRQVKRLERLGYVKITRVGSQNRIQLAKEKGSG
jgi:uncharacterized membrane protein